MRAFLLLLTAVATFLPLDGRAQTPPTSAELRAYGGLHAAAAEGDVAAIERWLASGSKAEAQDSNGRTALHVAAFAGRHAAAQTLMRLGANPNALDAQRYDIITIAAVANDVEMLKVALAGGANPGAMTSPYDGTALIAAAHLGHAEVVRTLIAAKAPLDHVNNLGWTALIEAVILGNGGKNHIATVEALVKAGANMSLADREGRTPLAHAQARNYAAIVDILKSAGAK